tara:strand:+ start:184 stop:564 length:381 start_codon:yes stop_codon:yes gene_type:complete
MKINAKRIMQRWDVMKGSALGQMVDASARMRSRPPARRATRQAPLSPQISVPTSNPPLLVKHHLARGRRLHLPRAEARSPQTPATAPMWPRLWNPVPRGIARRATGARSKRHPQKVHVQHNKLEFD